MSDYAADIVAAVKVMRRGGVIAYPTDTVWGIGCDATCTGAVKRIFEIKRRADSKALITLVGDIDLLHRVVGGRVPDKCQEFIKSQSPRPVTMVYPRGEGVAKELLAPDGSIGIRFTPDGFPGDLCRAMGVPVVSTSANISGKPSPSVYSEIPADILEAVDYVCQTGRDNLAPSRPSMVAKLNADGEIIILRD